MAIICKINNDNNFYGQHGFDPNGFNKDGYDIYGFDKYKLNNDGLNKYDHKKNHAKV